MKVIYIYNINDANEVALLDRAKAEMLANHIEEVECVDFQAVKDIYKIRATPALILIRDDFQGANMLDEVAGGNLRVTAELLKAMSEEDQNIHSMTVNRVDYLINKQVSSKMADNAQVMDDMSNLLIEHGVI